MPLFPKFKIHFKKKRKTKSPGFNSYKRPTRNRKTPLQKKSVKTPQKHTRLQKRKAAFKNKILIAFKGLLILALLASLIYGVFFTQLFEIQSIEVNGDDGTFDQQSDVQNYLDDYLGKNLLFFNIQIHTESLTENHPTLKSISVSKSLFHTLSAHLKTYENVANIELQDEDGSKEFHVINEEGFVTLSGTILETLPTIIMESNSLDSKLPTANISIPTEESDEFPTTDNTEVTSPDEASPTPSSSAPQSSMEALIDKETLNMLLQAKSDFEGKFDMSIIRIEYLKKARELHLHTERGFTVWIDLTKDLASQLNKLKKALTELNIYEANIDYIDLRISGQNGEKVIYKLVE
jgi:cell division septal protein FtsQ